MAAPFHLTLLGSPRLSHAGQPVRFRTKKQLAVLTYLHLAGRHRAVPRDTLVELFWPEAAPAKARHSLSQALLAIRERLGSAALTRRAQDVRLLAPLASDLDQLRAGGGGGVLPPVMEPLERLEECGGAELAHWVDAARARLRGEAREALRQAIRAARAQGRITQTHALAAALYGIDPLCADAVYALAERALLDGDAVAAVRLLGEQVRRAHAELGTNPNPEIVRLLRRLERGDGLPSHAPASALPVRVARREVFVGREAELSRLEALWDRGRTAGLQACLVTGAPGIGKSSLMRRFALSLAARTWPAFVVPCQEIGQGIPYAAVSDLMLALAADPRAGGTDPAWLAEGSRVCPGLRGVYPGIPQAPEAPTDSIRLRVAEAVLRMMETVTEGAPLLIAFDDLQFMDPASREVLFLVTRRLERVPTLILAGARAAGAPATEPGGAGLTWAATIELAPLDPAETARLLRDLAADQPVDDRICDTIVRLAGGNPYYVEMLLTDWRRHQTHSLVGAESAGASSIVTWSPPENLRAAFAREYAGLSADAQHVLQLLAVAGRAMAAADAAGVLGVDVRGIDRASLELLDRGLVRVERGGLAFKNELHRAYVYYAMGEEARSYFHSRLAEVLSRSTSGEAFQHTLEASHHYVKAGMPDEARHMALLGAEVAIRRGAPGEAERALESLVRSFPQGPDSRVHLLMASALVAAERYRDAIEALTPWKPASPARTDVALAAQLRAEALHRGRLADDAAILDAALHAVSIAEQARSDLILIRALQIRAEVAAEFGKLEDAVTASSQAEAAAKRSASAECKALAQVTAGYCLLVAGKLEEASATFAAAVPLLRDLGLLVELWRSYNGLGICNTGLVRIRDAVDSFAEALVVARGLGDDAAVLSVSNNLGVAYHEAGCFNWARRCYELPLLRDASPLPSRHVVPMYNNRARLAAESGDLAEAERLCSRSLSTANDSQSWRLIAMALLQRADLHIAMAEPEWAWPLVRDAVHLVGERWGFLADPAQFARLHAHMLWATSGEIPPSGEFERGPLRGPQPSLAHQLEFHVFLEWMNAARDRPYRGEHAHTLVAQGLFGAFARFLTLGIHLPNLPEPNPGESSASLVARVFEPEQRLDLSTAVSNLLQPTGERCHYV